MDYSYRKNFFWVTQAFQQAPISLEVAINSHLSKWSKHSHLFPICIHVPLPKVTGLFSFNKGVTVGFQHCLVSGTQRGKQACKAVKNKKRCVSLLSDSCLRFLPSNSITEAPSWQSLSDGLGWVIRVLVTTSLWTDAQDLSGGWILGRKSQVKSQRLHCPLSLSPELSHRTRSWRTTMSQAFVSGTEFPQVADNRLSLFCEGCLQSLPWYIYYKQKLQNVKFCLKQNVVLAIQIKTGLACVFLDAELPLL